MKFAFFFLLVLNMIFFAWGYFLDGQSSTRSNTSKAGSNAPETILLLHETQKPENQESDSRTKKSKVSDKRSELRLLDELPEMVASLSDDQVGGTFEVGLNEQVAAVADSLTKSILAATNAMQAAQLRFVPREPDSKHLRLQAGRLLPARRE